MKRSISYLTAVLAAAAMAVLILDTKTALYGGAEGVDLCIKTLIPSLFPFFLVSILLTSSLMGQKIPFLVPLAKLLRVPSGAEPLLTVGLLGGYPVGAQSIAQARKNGNLSDSDARRMMAFCSNAGPAFLFGIGSRLFSSVWTCWLLWGIHIVSAWIVGILTPGGRTESIQPRQEPTITLSQALRKALEVMAMVCGWVVIFRVLLAILERWILWMLPAELQILMYGFLEIANGCCALQGLQSEGMRLVLFSGFLGFGGLCVALQTYSVTAGSGVDTSLYLPGKLTQCAFSVLLACGAQPFLSEDARWSPNPWIICICLIVCAGYCLLQRKGKMTVAFRRNLVYNEVKST